MTRVPAQDIWLLTFTLHVQVKHEPFLLLPAGAIKAPINSGDLGALPDGLSFQDERPWSLIICSWFIHRSPQGCRAPLHHPCFGVSSSAVSPVPLGCASESGVGLGLGQSSSVRDNKGTLSSRPQVDRRSHATKRNSLVLCSVTCSSSCALAILLSSHPH